MELWIRGQDKLDLLKCKSIHIEEIPSSIEVAIICYASGDRYSTIGIYKSKERALEVLNEIQKQIKNSVDIIENKSYTEGSYRPHELNINIPYTKTIVYEMPKE